MTGSLQIKNNKYYVVLNYKGEDNVSKRKWISTGLEVKNNKTKAQKILQDYLESSIKIEIAQNKLKDDIIIESLMLFTDFLDKWLEYRKGQLSPLTIRGYWNIINRVKYFFINKNTKLNELKPLHIEEYYRYLMDSGTGGNTVLHHHVVIRKALDYACKNDLITSNPADNVERPKKGNYRSTIYNKNEFEQLFAVFKDSVVEVPVYLTAFYGLRRSEVLGLKWSAVDFNRRIIEIKHKVVELHGQADGDTLLKSDVLKNDSSHRILPLLPQVEQLLKNEKERIKLNKQFFAQGYSRDDEEYICLNKQGELIKPAYLTEQFSKILKQNNLKHIRFHDLRHSCASAMLAEHVPMKQIQEWLGHATFSTTADIYSHLDYSSKIESAKQVEKVFSFYDTGTVADSAVQDVKIEDLMKKYDIKGFSQLQDILEKNMNN